MLLVGLVGGPNASGLTTTIAGATGTNADLTKLPVGDGKYATSATKGYIYSCQTSFSSNGGAVSNVPWISNGTYNFNSKPVVSGSVSWQGTFTITLQGTKRMVTGNGLPNHATGTYPIKSTDTAYQYDKNPNSISSQNVQFEFDATPQVASQPTCLSMGAIGILTTGSAFYNALDEAGRDAVAHETQDSCQGHPDKSGTYHYHSVTTCVSSSTTGSHSPLVGYALDGFGIYGPLGESGQTLTDSDLDECHGHTHSITWDGQTVTLYHYHATYEYPYTLGCYRGTPAKSSLPGGSPSQGSSPQGSTSQGGQTSGQAGQTGGQQGGRTGGQTGGQQGGQQAGQQGGQPGGPQGGPPGGVPGGPQGGPPGGPGGQGGPPGGPGGRQAGPQATPQVTPQAGSTDSSSTGTMSGTPNQSSDQSSDDQSTQDTDDAA